MTVVDFESERAERASTWTRWGDQAPQDQLVIRIRGEVPLSGQPAPAPPGSLFVRRGEAVCRIEANGSLHAAALGRKSRDALEWTPG